MNKKVELIKDVVAAASILTKFECEDIFDTQQGFINFLSEAGFTTPTGKPLTLMNFRIIASSLTPKQRLEVMQEFDASKLMNLMDMMYSETNVGNTNIPDIRNL